MEEIKLYIISDAEKEDQVNYQISSENDNKNKIDINIIKEDYKEWIKDLIILMNSCSYRRVLGEIEKRKHLFKALDIFDLWKYKILKSKAIFKIIKIKLKKYKLEIKKENPLKISSIKFWFNQIFVILEELISDFIPNKDNNIDLDSFKVIKPIQTIISIYLELIFLLIQFYYQRNGGNAEICSYLSILNLFNPYLSLITDVKTIYFLQDLFLFKAKIYFQNRNYLQSIEQQNKVINLCLRIFLYVNDLDSQLYNLSSRNNNTKDIFNNFVNYIISFYYRGVTFEHLGDIQSACQAYTQSKLIYMKYLIEDNEKFGMFLNKIYNETRLILDINNDIKIIIKKRKENERKNNLRKKMRGSIIHLRNGYRTSTIEEKKDMYIYDKNNHSLINHNMHYKRIIRPQKVIRGIKNKYRVEQLEKYLNHIGKNLYIEEENMNNNLINKYKKSKYILSTITMIDNLLSKDFQKILMKMDNIEITKPNEEIKNMIDKTILTKRVKLFNIKLKNKKRQNSALNIFRSHRTNLFKDNQEYTGFKTSMAKNTINKKVKKTIHINRNINRNKYFETSQEILFNKQKQKSRLCISQRIPDTTKYKRKLTKENDDKKNLSIKDLNNRIKSRIERVKEKKRCLSNYGQIVKYPIDNENFSKSQLRKKKYLDKYLDKEFLFQKQLLNSKRNEVKDISEIEFYNQINACESAERDFDMILNVQKSNYNTKFISNLITMKQIKINNDKTQNRDRKYKMNDLLLLQIKKDMINAKYNRQKRRKGITEINLKKLVDRKNEEDMKKLSVECLDLSFKRKKLENKRRNLILNVSKSSIKKFDLAK
jgi:hypothetical protein